jgi:hypothetical protein
MKSAFDTLGSLLNKLSEEQLVESLPVFSQMTSDLFEEIKKSSDVDSSAQAFDLLEAISWPIASLSFKYNRELPNELMMLLKFEPLSDADHRKQLFDELRKSVG